MSVDLETMSITDNRQLRFPFELDSFRRNRMMKGLDDIGSILEHEPALRAFEQRDTIPPPAITGPVDVKISRP